MALISPCPHSGSLRAGWTAVGLTACSLFLSRHAQAQAWGAMARRWMFATCAAAADAKDQGQVG